MRLQEEYAMQRTRMSPAAPPPLLKRPTIDEGDDAPVLARPSQPLHRSASFGHRVEVPEYTSFFYDDEDEDDDDDDDTPYGGTMDMSVAVDRIHRHWDSVSCYGDINTSATCSTASSSGADYSSYYAAAADHYVDSASYRYRHVKKATKLPTTRSTGEVFNPPLCTITLKPKRTKLESLSRAVTNLVGGLSGAAASATGTPRIRRRRNHRSRSHHNDHREMYRSPGSDPGSMNQRTVRVRQY